MNVIILLICMAVFVGLGAVFPLPVIGGAIVCCAVLWVIAVLC